MTYTETIAYLYSQLPVFHRIGAAAYKPGLGNINALCALLGNPQTKFPTIHIAGTNGKGSSSHTIAAVLQVAGYKTGLYTSPHLKDFSERIRINGVPIAENAVIEFVAKYQTDIETIKPSFFEVTVALAFCYFAEAEVDIAVIEVGMGGRLDSTNVITPLVSLITNISYDHQAFLGNTLPEIATEKAGIIKPNVPIVISEYQPETAATFIETARLAQAPIYFAQDYFKVEWVGSSLQYMKKEVEEVKEEHIQSVVPQLKGLYQLKNIAGVLKVLDLLEQQGLHILPAHVREGIENVTTLTGLKGRWQILQTLPTVVCDTGHNEAGVREVVAQIEATEYNKLYLILGFSADKDLSKILPLYPTQASFHFCAYQAMRSMQVADLVAVAQTLDIIGEAHLDVNEALAYCLSKATSRDLIVIGGSTFVVAEIKKL